MSAEDQDEFWEPPRPWPAWVKLTLWGLPGRGWAWGGVWFSLLLAVGCIAAGFVFSPAFFGSFFVFAAIWYWMAIHWVDRYSKWP